MTLDREMKQIAINLYNNVSLTLHARSGVHLPYNIMDCPPTSSDGVYKCLTAHYHKISSRNIFRGFKEQAIIVIGNGQSNTDNEHSARNKV